MTLAFTTALAIASASELSLAQQDASANQTAKPAPNGAATSESPDQSANAAAQPQALFAGSALPSEPGSTPNSGVAAEKGVPVTETPQPSVGSQVNIAPESPLSNAAGSGAPTVNSWFDRPPLTASVGSGAKKLSLTLYGFLEADVINDTTRSYGDAIGSSLVARSETYAGRVGRSQFSMRNTRLGLAFESPIFEGVQTSAVFEGDFFGNQPSDPPATSEAAYYDSPTFRLRHAYLKLENDYVDVLAGQTYDVFGWQNYFFPCSVEFLGLPNQLFSRHAQVRLSHTFGSSGPVSLDVAASALRPAQRDSQVPDGNAGLRLSVNDWKGITTPGNVGTTALPLSIGVSGTVRQFKVNAFRPPPVQDSNGLRGWGLSVDALVPLIPARNANDRGNRLTLTASFVTGTGIADLITANGGATFPVLANPAQANPPPEYASNIDNGLVTFDTQGVLHTIDWRAFRAGLQYYLPPAGRVLVSLNFTEADSKNMADLYPQGGAEIELLTRVAKLSRYADANVFWDATPSVRFGVSVQYTAVKYIDGEMPHNLRSMGQALYVF
jgi:hypothetical protein